MRQDVIDQYTQKTTYELQQLKDKGILLHGYSYANCIFLVNSFDEMFFQDVQPALLKAFEALGYAPQDWTFVCSKNKDGNSLSAYDLRLVFATLDAKTLVLLDDAACSVFYEAYKQEFTESDEMNEPPLTAGQITWICGMRVMNVNNFATSLGDAQEKQIRWSYLKKLTPVTELY